MARKKNTTTGPVTKPADKNKFPPNLYLASNGKTWILDFCFRGERYKETLGPVSRTIAKETAGKRKTAVAEGRIVVNGKRWTDRQWIVDETDKGKIADPAFDTAIEQYVEWYAMERPKSTSLNSHSRRC